MHLILLQPGLVVMDEEVYGVERRVLYSTSPGVGPIMSCWMEDQRVSWLVEPVLALAVFVGQRHQIVVLNMGAHCCITDLSQMHGYTKQ